VLPREEIIVVARPIEEDQKAMAPSCHITSTVVPATDIGRSHLSSASPIVVAHSSAGFSSVVLHGHEQMVIRHQRRLRQSDGQHAGGGLQKKQRRSSAHLQEHAGEVCSGDGAPNRL
jgi:hypothetical protein